MVVEHTDIIRSPATTFGNPDKCSYRSVNASRPVSALQPLAAPERMPTLYRLTIENTTQDLIKPGSAVLRRIPPVPFEAGLQIGLPITLCTLYFPCRPKHPVKVHVWAGISMRGRTGICILDGMMDGKSCFHSETNATAVPV